MKVTTSTPEKEFEPIVLTITIESEEELAELRKLLWSPRNKLVDPLYQLFSFYDEKIKSK